jgi:hypothetical protein
MRKAFLIETAEYVITFNNTVFNDRDMWDSDMFYVKGDLRDKYGPGSIVVFESTEELVPATHGSTPYYYWKEVTE